MAIGYSNGQSFEYTPTSEEQVLEQRRNLALEQAITGMLESRNTPTRPMGPVPFWSTPQRYYPEYFQEQPQQKNPVDQQADAVNAAIQFQGIRGYQKDLEKGTPAFQAFAKWGPMMLRQDTRGLAPTLKTLAPTPNPEWVPANPSTGQPGYMKSGPVVKFAPEYTAEKPDLSLGKNISQFGGRNFYQNPKTGALTPLDQKPENWKEKINYRQATEEAAKARAILADERESTANKKIAEKMLADANKVMASGPESSQSDQSDADLPTPPLEPKQREKRLYKTPKGVFFWTGEGWLKQ